MGETQWRFELRERQRRLDHALDRAYTVASDLIDHEARRPDDERSESTDKMRAVLEVLPQFRAWLERFTTYVGER